MDVQLAPVVPAVAGYVMRLEFAQVEIKAATEAAPAPMAPINFMLAARLAGVAKLNVKAGMKPRIARRSDAAMPPVPTARLAAKAQRQRVGGSRVLQQKPARPSAKIIPFPGNTTGAAGAAVRARRAA